MTLALNAPGTPAGLGGGVRGLWRPLRSSSAGTDPTGFAGPWPNSIAGLSGWWDAGLTGQILSPSGGAIAGWNSSVGSLADRSGGSRAMLPFSSAAPSGRTARRGRPAVDGNRPAGTGAQPRSRLAGFGGVVRSRCRLDPLPDLV